MDTTKREPTLCPGTVWSQPLMTWCVKSIQDGFIHQTMGTKETEEECSLDYAIGAPVEKEITYALTNSLGFGGHNASLLLKKYEG